MPRGLSAAASWGVLIAIFGPALLLTSLWHDAGGLDKYAALTIGAGVALLGLIADRNLGPMARMTFLDAAVAAYVGWTAVATVFSPMTLLSVTGYRGYWDGLAATAAAATVYFAFRLSLGFQPRIWARISVAACVTTLILLLALVPAWLGSETFRPLINYGRAASLFGQTDFLAGFAVTWLPLLSLAAASAWRSKRRDVRSYLLLLGAPVLLFLLVATLSRSGWLAAAIATTLWLALSAPNPKQGIVRAGVALLVAAVMGAGLLALRSGADPFSERLASWSYALQATAEHPLVGTGPGTYAYTFSRFVTPADYRQGFTATFLDAHNWYVNAASTTGIAGGMAALAVAVGALGLAYRARRRTGPELAAACGAVGYFVHCIFTPNSITTFVGALAVLGIAVAQGESGAQRSADAEKHRLPTIALKGVAALIGIALIASGTRTAAAQVIYLRSTKTGSVAAATTASALSPEDWTYALHEARIYARQGMYEPAVEALREALERSPRDAQLAHEAARLLKPIAVAKQDAEYEQLTLSWFANAVRLAPAQPEYRANYAVTLALFGDVAEGEKQLERLERWYGPDDEYVIYLRSRIGTTTSPPAVP